MVTQAFIDASNLFYGGLKSLGWKIDYQKLLDYLKQKYQVEQAYYFGGVETHGYQYNYLSEESVPLVELKRFLEVSKLGLSEDGDKLEMLDKKLRKVNFYLKLQKFGFLLVLKPVKIYTEENGTKTRKANCDVDMAFYLMKEKHHLDRAIILSGDGDFLPVLKHLNSENKEVIVIARADRTAREIKQFAKSRFRDFEYLKYLLSMDGI